MFAEGRPTPGCSVPMTNTRPTTHYSITAAHRITGKSRTTIQRHLKKGKLSFVEDDDGIKRIDASELIRVYGDDCDFSRERTEASQEVGSGSIGEGWQARHNPLAEKLDWVESERERERRQLEERVQYLEQALALAQEGQNRATLLLENQSRGAAAESRLAMIEQRLEAAQPVKQKTAQAEWHTKPWWRVLWS